MLPALMPFLQPFQGVKEFKCEVCGREFTLQANMKRHMLIHTSVRPYQCHICFKTFVQKQTLKTHMIVHSPVKPFKCKVPAGSRVRFSAAPHPHHQAMQPGAVSAQGTQAEMGGPLGKAEGEVSFAFPCLTLRFMRTNLHPPSRQPSPKAGLEQRGVM